MVPRDLAGNAAKLDSCEAAGAPLGLPLSHLRAFWKKEVVVLVGKERHGLQNYHDSWL
jgi:hypothetical protein